MTRAKVEIEMTKVLNAYADPSVWDAITGTPGYEEKLDALVPELLDAAQRNGVNISEALKTARSHVLAKYYDQFWRAFNREETDKLEEASESVVRLHGTLAGLRGSLTAKEGRYNRLPSGEQLRLARTLYMRGVENVVPDGAVPSRNWTNVKRSKKTVAGLQADE
jgi:hypothetical protein